MAVDPETLRAVMRHWASGVTIVTARDGAQAHGMTVSSFTSISLEPPLVLVCIEQSVRTHALIESSRAFAISILCVGQESISDRFAGRETENSDRFEGLSTHTAMTGAPILTENLGYLDCVLVAAHPVGTHTIFVGEVVAASAGPRARAGCSQPLVYYRRDYHALADH